MIHVWTDEQAGFNREQGQEEEATAEDKWKVCYNLQQVILQTLAHVVKVLTEALQTWILDHYLLNITSGMRT